MASLDVERYAQKVKEDPRSLAFVALAEALRKAGRADEALAALRQGHVHHPDQPSARFVAARLHDDAGRPALAADILVEVVQQDPANDAARGLLVRLLLGQRRLAEARAQLDALRMAGIGEATGVGVTLPPVERPAPPEDPFDSDSLIRQCVSSGDYGRALAIAGRAEQGAPSTGGAERLADLAWAAGGRPVSWVEALEPRAYRVLPGRAKVAAALAGETTERPTGAERYALSAALWPAGGPS